MRTYINSDTNQFQDAPDNGAFGGISFKRGDTQSIILGWASAGSVYELDPGGTPALGIRFGIKATGDYAGSYVVSNWNGSSFAYTKASPILITDAVLTALTAATNTLTSDNTIPANGDTVTIGSKVYTLKTTLTPTEGEVLINGSADAALLNLIRAINHTGTPNTDYKCAAANTDVSAASSVTAHAFAVTALTAGVAGNLIATTETSAHLAWGATTLTGGADGFTMTSASAAFTSADIGRTVIGTGIPANTTISTVASSTSVTLSAAITTTGTGVSVNILGRRPTYTVAPSFNTVELNDLLITPAINQTVADQTARYALTGKANGYIVRQVDTGSYWVVIDNTALSSSAGWSSDVPEKDSVSCIMEVEWTLGTSITSTATVAVTIYNDVNKGSEGVPTSATPTGFYISQYARLLAITNGFKIQVSTDGSTWQDGPSYTAT